MNAIDTAAPVPGARPRAVRDEPAAQERRDNAFSRIVDALARQSADAKAAKPAAAAMPPTAADNRTAAADSAGMLVPASEPATLTGERTRTPPSALPGFSSDKDESRRPPERADELTRLLGLGPGSADNAPPAPVRSGETGGRRAMLPFLPPVREAEAGSDQPKPTARITVIGRETHFAPTDLPQADLPQADLQHTGQSRADRPVAAKRAIGTTGAALRPAGDALVRPPADVSARASETSPARHRDATWTARAGAPPDISSATPTGTQRAATTSPVEGDDRVREAPARNMPERDMPERSAPARNALSRSAPERGTHARDVHARDVHARDMHARDMQGRDTPDRDVQARNVQARNVQQRDTQGWAMQARDVQGQMAPPAGANVVAQVVDGAVPLQSGALLRVADQIAAAARDLTAAGSAPSLTSPVEPPAHNGPVRVLRLQLQPAELGLVTARLRIVGGVLELRLSVDRQQSVAVLQRDREGLVEVLQRAGYKAEIAAIDFARPPAAPPAPNGGGSGQPPGHQAAQDGGGFGGFDRPAGQNPAAGGGSAHHRHPDGRQPIDGAATGHGEASAGRPDDPQAVYL